MSLQSTSTCHQRVITQTPANAFLSDLNPQPQTLCDAAAHHHVYLTMGCSLLHRLVAPRGKNMALPFMRRFPPCLPALHCKGHPQPFLMWGHFDSNWMMASSCRPHKPGHFVPSCFRSGSIICPIRCNGNHPSNFFRPRIPLSKEAMSCFGIFASKQEWNKSITLVYGHGGREGRKGGHLLKVGGCCRLWSALMSVLSTLEQRFT